MKTLSKRFCTVWPERWKYPDLWIALCAQPDPADLPAGLVARAMARYALEHPSPTDVFGELLRRGEFAAAEALRVHDAFVNALQPEDDEILGRELADARSRAIEAARERAWQIEQQAREIALPDAALGEQLSRSLAEVSESAERCKRTLDVAAAEVAEARRNRTEELEGRLETRTSTDETDITSTAWFEGVRRCLRSGDLDVAGALLERGPAAQPAMGSKAIPLRDPWPASYDLDEAYAWFTGRGGSVDRGFLTRWQMRDGDDDAVAMIAALAPAVGDPQGWSGPDVSGLGTALERFLGCPPQPPVEARRDECGFWVRLRGLDLSILPALRAAFGEDGLPLLVPTAGVVHADQLGDHPIVLALQGTTRTALPRRALPLQLEDLYRLVRAPHRSVNFLRVLGSWLPVDLAIPERGGYPLQPAPFGEVRETVRALADALGVRFDREHYLDRLVYLAGFRPAIATRLLRWILVHSSQAVRPRRVFIDRAQIDTTWKDEVFQEGAVEQLLEQLSATARRVLGAVFFARGQDLDASEPVTHGDVEVALELAEVELPGEDLATALTQLVADGYLQQAADGSLAPAAGGVGRLLASALSDPADW